MKDYDRRFAFYPGFSVERSIVLEYRAKYISRLSTEIHALRKESVCGNAGEPSKLPTTRVMEERLEGLLSRLADSLAQYGGKPFFIYVRSGNYY